MANILIAPRPPATAGLRALNRFPQKFLCPAPKKGKGKGQPRSPPVQGQSPPLQQASRESGSRRSREDREVEGGDICIGRLVNTLKNSARSPSNGSGVFQCLQPRSVWIRVRSSWNVHCAREYREHKKRCTRQRSSRAKRGFPKSCNKCSGSCRVDEATQLRVHRVRGCSSREDWRSRWATYSTVFFHWTQCPRPDPPTRCIRQQDLFSYRNAQEPCQSEADDEDVPDQSNCEDHCRRPQSGTLRWRAVAGKRPWFPVVDLKHCHTSPKTRTSWQSQSDLIDQSTTGESQFNLEVCLGDHMADVIEFDLTRCDSDLEAVSEHPQHVGSNINRVSRCDEQGVGRDRQRRRLVLTSSQVVLDSHGRRFRRVRQAIQCERRDVRFALKTFRWRSGGTNGRRSTCFFCGQQKVVGWLVDVSERLTRLRISSFKGSVGEPSQRSRVKGIFTRSSGWTYEHMRVLLDDVDTFNLFFEAASSFAQASVKLQRF